MLIKKETKQKKKREQKKKKKQRTATPGVEPGLSARASNSWPLYLSDTHDLKINFVISEQFFSAIDAV